MRSASRVIVNYSGSAQHCFISGLDRLGANHGHLLLQVVEADFGECLLIHGVIRQYRASVD
jgi:hypothetical protein